MDNPFDWAYLTTVPGPNEVFGPFSTVYLIVFLIGFAVSVLLYNGVGRKQFPNPVLFNMARRWGGIGVVVFGLGLFFFGIRALQINPFTFGMRIWLWLSLLGLLAMLGYIVWDYRSRYTQLYRGYQEQLRREQYMRKGSLSANRRVTAADIPIGARPVRRKRR
jgi:hypothetical protein